MKDLTGETGSFFVRMDPGKSSHSRPGVGIECPMDQEGGTKYAQK
jgi:hypothetical protein